MKNTDLQAAATTTASAAPYSAGFTGSGGGDGSAWAPLASGSAPARASPSGGGAERKRPPRRRRQEGETPGAGQKRRCISTACVACRKRKSRCDGAAPRCAACASVYGTECVYDPGSDHRRKGVYRDRLLLDNLKAGSSTLQILVSAILNADEDEVGDIVRRVRSCESLDALAEELELELAGGGGGGGDGDGGDGEDIGDGDYGQRPDTTNATAAAAAAVSSATTPPPPTSPLPVEGELELARKMGELRLENDSVRFIGGTSHLIYLGETMGGGREGSGRHQHHGRNHDGHSHDPEENPITSWTSVSKDARLVIHLLNLYFTWHYPYFTTLSKSLFQRDFLAGRAAVMAAAAAAAASPPPSESVDSSSFTPSPPASSSVPSPYDPSPPSLPRDDEDGGGRRRQQQQQQQQQQQLGGGGGRSTTVYCTPLLVNAMLALGCHFSALPGAFAVPGDSRTKGDHFFAEARRLIAAEDECERPRLATVQALALMSVREAGCGREARGWAYSGMSFRMAQDIGLDLDMADPSQMGEHEMDARRITFWGCFHFDKAWSNYLGRLPQIPQSACSVPKYDVFPDEDAEWWWPHTDEGFSKGGRVNPDAAAAMAAAAAATAATDPSPQGRPSRTRAVALRQLTLSEISSDLLLFFYHPNHIRRPRGRSAELRRLSELHRRLEDWRRDLPAEFEPAEGQLPNVILMHMFFHLQYIHLFRPFLKYTPATSPLPAHVSPRRICTANAGAISKLMRLYKRTWGLRQICNIAVYMVHSACTIHLLNLPGRTARRDITHGVRHLEEIAEDWLCARRTLGIISVLARKWGCELPEDASEVLRRTDERFGTVPTCSVPSPCGSAGGSACGSVGSGPGSSALPMLRQLQLQPNLPPTIPSDFLLSPESSPLASQQNHHGQMAHISLAAAVTSAVATWAPSSPAPGPGPGPGSGSVPVNLQAPLSSYNLPRPAPPMPPAPPPPPPLASPMPPHQTPLGLDGQDWFLHDGVRWHQNFEPWAPPQQQETGGGAGCAGGSGSSQQGPSADGLFLYPAEGRADDGGGMFAASFQGMEMWGWMQGLD